jgi:hypothetical protein
LLQVFAKRAKKESSGGSGLRKYQTWAYLNAEGKKLWGDVFPDGEVPIQSMIAQAATLEGIDGIGRVFLVDWKELSTEQQKTVLEKISKMSGVSKDAILKDVLKVGLPLRQKYTEGCGTSRMELF